MIGIIKQLCLLVILILCSYVGFSIGSNFKKRWLNLIELNNSLIFLQNEILYCHTPLPEALNRGAKKLNGIIGKMLKITSKSLCENNVDNVYMAFENSINECKEETYFKEEDNKMILDFARNLGECGIYGQDKIFELMIERLKKQINIAEEEYIRNQKMYRYLGISFGAMIAIFLI